jgi:hypothetical protein
MEENTMKLPFTPEQFFDVFRQYNLAVWPMQIFFYILAIAALFLAVKETKYSNRVITTILAFFWLWIGIAYHLIYFSSINPAAYIFAGLFSVQGILFFISDTAPQKPWYRFHINNYSIIGTIFILYGLIIYPIWGYYLGHIYPQSPTFGLPCPTTIFTFGLLLWTDTKIPKYLLVIPMLWSLIGFLAAIQLGILEDIMLLATGLMATSLIWYRDKKLGGLSPSFSSS